MTESGSLFKKIICSLRDFETLKRKYPKKEVIPSIYQPQGQFIVCRREGIFSVHMNDWTVWIPDEFPYFKKWSKHKANK